MRASRTFLWFEEDEAPAEPRARSAPARPYPDPGDFEGPLDAPGDAVTEPAEGALPGPSLPHEPATPIHTRPVDTGAQQSAEHDLVDLAASGTQEPPGRAPFPTAPGATEHGTHTGANAPGGNEVAPADTHLPSHFVYLPQIRGGGSPSSADDSPGPRPRGAPGTRAGEEHRTHIGANAPTWKEVQASPTSQHHPHFTPSAGHPTPTSATAPTWGDVRSGSDTRRHAYLTPATDHPTRTGANAPTSDELPSGSDTPHPPHLPAVPPTTRSVTALRAEAASAPRARAASGAPAGEGHRFPSATTAPTWGEVPPGSDPQHYTNTMVPPEVHASLQPPGADAALAMLPQSWAWVGLPSTEVSGAYPGHHEVPGAYLGHHEVPDLYLSHHQVRGVVPRGSPFLGAPYYGAQGLVAAGMWWPHSAAFSHGAQAPAAGGMGPVPGRHEPSTQAVVESPLPAFPGALDPSFPTHQSPSSVSAEPLFVPPPGASGQGTLVPRLPPGKAPPHRGEPRTARGHGAVDGAGSQRAPFFLPEPFWGGPDAAPARAGLANQYRASLLPHAGGRASGATVWLPRGPPAPASQERARPGEGPGGYQGGASSGRSAARRQQRRGRAGSQQSGVPAAGRTAVASGEAVSRSRQTDRGGDERDAGEGGGRREGAVQGWSAVDEHSSLAARGRPGERAQEQVVASGSRSVVSDRRDGDGAQDGAGDASVDRRATVILKNLSMHARVGMLIRLLEDSGYRDMFDFLYVPLTNPPKKGVRSCSFGFVNFLTPEAARRAVRDLDASALARPDRAVEVTFSQVQGRHANEEQFWARAQERSMEGHEVESRPWVIDSGEWAPVSERQGAIVDGM
uniref:RRM domain-containing protein n=1 Tax=Oxyrrhis marina TaxID=2969 RepID=A0A7S4LN60_OXYMA